MLQITVAGLLWSQVWEMHALLAEGVASGEVQPLPHTIYGRDHMQDALRFLASGGWHSPC